MGENCCENYTDDPKDNNLIDEIANTLPTDTKFVKDKSAMEKCLDLARDPNPDSGDEAASSDLFLPDVDPAPNPMALEGAIADNIPVDSGQDSIEGPPADEQLASVDFGLLDLETAGLRRSDRQRKPIWKLADPINKKLKQLLGCSVL